MARIEGGVPGPWAGAAGPAQEGVPRAGADTGDGGWQGLARRSLWASGVKSLAIVAGVSAGLVRFLLGRDWPVGGMVAACAGAAVLVIAAVVTYDVLRLRTTRWRLTPDRLELRSGITVRQHRSIPRDRVRSVDLRADPVNRMFGLTVVKVGTGEHAEEGAELKLDPLTRHDAEALRRVLLHQGAEAAEAGGGPLAELSWSWVRYAPLSVWTFTGAAVVLGALYKALDSFGLKRFTTRLATGLWEWLVAQPMVAVPLLLAVNVVVGVLGAVLLFAESWGRYRLEREPGRLRVRRGLLTSRSLTLEERRLRGVELNEPLLLRLGGAARLRSIATGLGKSAEGETEDVAALTPPMPRAQAVRVAAAIAGADVPGLAAGPTAARHRAPGPTAQRTRARTRGPAQRARARGTPRGGPAQAARTGGGGGTGHRVHHRTGDGDGPRPGDGHGYGAAVGAGERLGEHAAGRLGVAGARGGAGVRIVAGRGERREPGARARPPPSDRQEGRRGAAHDRARPQGHLRLDDHRDVLPAPLRPADGLGHDGGGPGSLRRGGRGPRRGPRPGRAGRTRAARTLPVPGKAMSRVIPHGLPMPLYWTNMIARLRCLQT
uniref:Transmembrane protein, distant homology with ydbT n=1 Tax=Nonomuraea gerenzanensis TaxID=93944 RepID=A0A1M4E6S3_9ACTN|nr:PH domain-containing protein [Nonomuraea gerenzanensis]SBO94474.1 transmembrane protein, distant homology with ydbT [Nonomuraea gerenzanensis]